MKLRRKWLVGGGCLLSVALLWACGGGAVEGTSAAEKEGLNDTCAGNTEVCDGVDNDCDGEVDEGFDQDEDGVRACDGDCNDRNRKVGPHMTEVVNGVDDDCDGRIDKGDDADGDGTSYPEDCDDRDPLVGPLSFEVSGDKVDNDCDGKVDEAANECEGGLLAEAAAIGMCAPWLVANSAADGSMTPDGKPVQSETKVSLPGGGSFVPQKGTWALGNTQARSIRTAFGKHWKPRQGKNFLLLSTGEARSNVSPERNFPQPGKNWGTDILHPLGLQLACPNGVSARAEDASELRLQVLVPMNARSLRFDFAFFSAEFPEASGRPYNDRFVATLDSVSFRGNVSRDAQGKDITIDSALFDICDDCARPWSLLDGTGFDDDVAGFFAHVPAGGSTGWLTTVAPVTPGETVNLRFVVSDECGGLYDSAVLLDAFEWSTRAVAAPETTAAK